MDIGAALVSADSVVLAHHGRLPHIVSEEHTVSIFRVEVSHPEKQLVI
jgi:hypothetical protein